MENIQLDSESYWHRSSSKAFSFDDDDTDGVTSKSYTKFDGILNDDTISEASFDNSAAVGGALNLSIKAVICDEALKLLLQEQTLDDRILSKGMTLEEELKSLRRQIQTTLYSPSAEATAHKLLLGKSVPLEVFKSLHEKQQLLDVVLQKGGGDAVTGVLLSLKKTLNRTNFNKILEERPRAMQHYISYLKQCNSTEAVTLLQHFKKQQDAAVLEFQTTLACNALALRKRKLQQLLEHYSNVTSINSLYQQLFLATLKLLELIENEGNDLVHINSTPIEVLHACCRKNNNWKEHELTRTNSPFRLCVEQQISAAQFEWTALNERTSAQAYADLECIFERPTWHPMKQKQFHISFTLDLAILRLHALQAPNSVLYLFFTKMSNSCEKLELAKRVKCTKAVIDSLVGLKDIAQLTQLRDALPERSEENFYCEKALKDLQRPLWSTDNIRLKL